MKAGSFDKNKTKKPFSTIQTTLMNARKLTQSTRNIILYSRTTFITTKYLTQWPAPHHFY